MSSRQATAAQPSLAWLGQFLKDELTPYPGRGALVARMLLASSIVMLVTMTFQLPFGAYGAVYALIISREDRQSTVESVKIIFTGFAVGAVVVLIGARLFAGEPTLRLLWVIGMMFLIFFALSAMSNYTAAARFGYFVIVAEPLWDLHIPSQAKVTGTLWAVGTIGMASLVTAAIELAFASVRPSDDLLRSLGERLTAVEEVLRSCAMSGRVEESAVKKITRLGLLGTSRLRRVLQRSGHGLLYGEQMGATVVLVGRVVDLAATLVSLDFQMSGEDRSRVEKLADDVAKIRHDLMDEKAPELPARSGAGAGSPSIPLLREMETTVATIPQIFSGSPSLDAFVLPTGEASASPPFFVPDAFTNPEHIKFGLRGCLAASLCYIIYMATDWPGISTSVTTCFLTALTTVGASRQKQVLRFAGAIVGGAFGLAAQAWILPGIDSIFGFTLFFLVGTMASAWITTSGPRLSYFGVQLAISLYLITLQEFKIQTSLTVSRDRAAGVLLGLAMMWLFFDQLWSAPAAVEMRKTFISALRSLAQLTREPLSNNLRAGIERTNSLRETVNTNFNKVRALADGVLLEFGPSRSRDLALRGRIIQWQTQLRIYFVTRNALLRYRLQLPGFELPEPARQAGREFDDSVAQSLEKIADRLQGKPDGATSNLEAAFVRLKDSAPNPDSNVKTFLTLSERIAGVAISLDKEIENDSG